MNETQLLEEMQNLIVLFGKAISEAMEIKYEETATLLAGMRHELYLTRQAMLGEFVPN